MNFAELIALGKLYGGAMLLASIVFYIYSVLPSLGFFLLAFFAFASAGEFAMFKKNSEGAM